MHCSRLLAACLLALSSPLVWSQILIGQTAGFTGPVAAGVQETTDGARLYLDAVNVKGGVHGQKIELVSMDDKFDPPLAASNAKSLIEEKGVLALFLTRGTPHAEAIVPLLAQHGVALVAPSTGAMVLHQPVRRHVFNVRATYQREAEKAVDHLSSMGIQRIALVHADDSFGKDGLEGANKGLTKAKIQPAAVIKADRAKPDYTQIVPALIKAAPQAVLWIASGNAVADGVRALRAGGSAAQVVTAVKWNVTPAADYTITNNGTQPLVRYNTCLRTNSSYTILVAVTVEGTGSYSATLATVGEATQFAAEHTAVRDVLKERLFMPDALLGPFRLDVAGVDPLRELPDAGAARAEPVRVASSPAMSWRSSPAFSPTRTLISSCCSRAASVAPTRPSLMPSLPTCTTGSRWWPRPRRKRRCLPRRGSMGSLTWARRGGGARGGRGVRCGRAPGRSTVPVRRV